MRYGDDNDHASYMFRQSKTSFNHVTIWGE